MTWRERVKQEVLKVLAEHAEAGLNEQIAVDIADCIPSPDERNGYAIVSLEAIEAAEALLGGFMGSVSGYRRAEELRKRFRDILSTPKRN